MATIPVQSTGTRHVRKTITFTGGANAGQSGSPVTIFTGTGRYYIVRVSMYCSTGLTSSGGTFTAPVFGSSTDFAQINTLATAVTSGEWVGGGATNATAGYILAGEFLATGDVTLTVATADITGGVLVVDCFYIPITDDGALSGSDIDVSLESAINAEVVDALNVDTYAEPGQEAPGATVSLAKKISYLYKAWRNKNEATNSAYKLYADDGSTVDQKATLSDDGTTFTRTEIATGP